MPNILSVWPSIRIALTVVDTMRNETPNLKQQVQGEYPLKVVLCASVQLLL